VTLAARSVFQLGAVFLCTHAALLAQSGGGTPTSGGPYTATPQRPTFTADTATTAPGTLEIEFGATGTSSFGGFFALPTNMKYTPDVRRGLLHRAEFSLGFDAVSSAATPGGRQTGFGQTLSLIIRRPVYVGKSFSLAVAPRSIFFLRDGRGARVGARLLAAYNFGLNAVIANFTWTSATSSLATNPAQQYDVAFDYGIRLGESGWRQRTSLFAGFLTEKPKHHETSVTFGQGISYRLRPNYVLDFAVRERGLAAGPRGYELLAGFTANLGRLQ